MKVVVAIDSMKGSLTSLEAGQAAREGILAACPDADVVIKPVADGGEGTVEVLTEGLGGRFLTLTVTGPLGMPVTCRYGLLPDGVTAVMDMAAAALPLVPEDKRNPLCTTTYGVGEMIADALERGVRHIILGIGGSATNDGGIGMLQALGAECLDASGAPVAFGAQGLFNLASVSVERMHPALKQCRFSVACDVQNPLCGERGCSAVFAPQKGATPAMIEPMDRALAHYAALVKRICPSSDPTMAGAGAAGGMGFALSAFMNATLKNGIALVLELIGLEKDVALADVVVTGEGRLDAQTAMGKAPVGVAKIAKAHQKPVLAFGGGLTKGAHVCHDHGIDAMFPIVRGVTTLKAAMEPSAARTNLASAVEEAFRALTVWKGGTV